MRNGDDMRKASMVARALAVPAGLWATGVIVAVQLLVGEPDARLWFALAVAWLLVVAMREWGRRRRLEPLLRRPKRSVRALSVTDLGIPPGPETDAGSHPPDPELVKMLRARRLVLLCGPRDGERPRAVFTALQASFGSYDVLWPGRGLHNGKPPLTKLLTSGVLPLRGRFVLWLDDIGRLLDDGFDPRIIEKWLAAGRGRIAVGLISRADRDRVREAGTQAGIALERAQHIDVESAPRVPAVVERYRRETGEASLVVRLVAASVALGAAAPQRDAVEAVCARVNGAALDPSLIDRLCAGDESPLVADEDRLVPAQEVTAAVGEDMSRVLSPQLIEAMFELAEPEDLISMAPALAARGHPAEARRALRRAESTVPEELRPDVQRAQLVVLDMQDGSSGATLSHTGGLDFNEPMGPSQRKSVRDLLPPESDGAFDPSLPAEVEGRAARFYRLNVHRAVARVTLLVLFDTLAIATASMAALAVRAAARNEDVSLIDEDFVALVIPSAFVAVLLSVGLGLYRSDTARARPQQILAVMTVVPIVVAAGFFTFDVDFGTVGALVVLFMVGFVVDCVLRFGYDEVSRTWVRANRLQPRVLILGRPDEARSLAQNMNRREGRPVQPVAFLAPQTADDQFCVGTYRDLTQRLHELHISELAIADRRLSTSDKARIISEAQGFGLDVRFVARDEEVLLGAVGPLGEYGLVHVPAALMTPEALELKRILDHVVVTLTLPLWGLILAAYAGYIKVWRRGQPVLVAAERVGLGQIGFAMLRLRTRHFRDIRDRGIYPSGRVEDFFERTGLDELPQVINVLRNEMSIVGPRPLAAHDVRPLTLDQRRTLGARPGMTGRWQVAWPHGASEADMRALDADYLRRWRVSHDLELMIRTPIAIARRRCFLGDTQLRRVRGEPLTGPEVA
jgi:lipopolysaccharide/colanic/teichoic acid biosynthesis glycosyltransferase